MVKARIIFEKTVYAYLDVDEETLKDIETKCDGDYFGEEWREDKFNYPDSDWIISEVDVEDENEKYCVFGCGKKLDPDYDFENSCRKCE